jgi:hypothetical protein
MYGVRDTRSLRLSLCLLISLGVAACSSGNDATGPEESAQGSFNVTVSGGVSASFSGIAWQSGTIIDATTNERGWVLYLTTTDSNDASSVFVVRMGDRPGSGSYSLIDLTGSGDLENGDFGGITTVGIGGGLVFAGASTGGTVTITSSSEGRVEGSINFQITGFDPSSQQEVTATVSGTFNAVANTFVFPGL